MWFPLNASADSNDRAHIDGDYLACSQISHGDGEVGDNPEVTAQCAQTSIAATYQPVRTVSFADARDSIW